MTQQDFHCHVCGAHNESQANFCQSCGAKILRHEEKTCPACSNVSRAEARFCDLCGYSYQQEELASANVYAPPAKRTANHREGLQFARRIVKSSLILIVAICLALCSLLPTVSYRIKGDKDMDIDEEFSINLSMFDHIIFLFDALVDETDKEIAQSSLYDDYEDVFSDLQNIDGEELSRSDKKTIEKFVILTLRLGFRSEAASIAPRYIVPAVSSVAYTAFSLTFLGFAIYQFVKTLSKKSFNEKKTARLLCLAPFAVLINFLACQNSLFDSFEGVRITMGIGLLAFLVSSIVLVLILLDRYIFDRKRLVAKHMIASGLCLTLAITCMLLSFGGAFRLKTTGEFDNSSKTRTASVTIENEFYKEFELNDYSIDQLFSGTTKLDFTEQYNQILNSTAKEYSDGEANMAATMAVALTMYWWSGDAFVIYSAFYYVALLAGIFFALLAWRACVSLYDKSSRRSGCLAFSLSGMIAALLSLASNVVFVVIINMALEKYKFDDIIRTGISATPIVLTVLAIGALIASLLLPKRPRPTPLTTQNIPVFAENEVYEVKE